MMSSGGRGRPTNIDVWLRKAGEELRNNIRDALHAKGLTKNFILLFRGVSFGANASTSSP